MKNKGNYGYQKLLLSMFQKSRTLFNSYGSVFGQIQTPEQELSRWFSELSKDKQNYTYNGESAILINTCRETDEINSDTLLKIAKKLSGLDIESWGDELVLFFQGKLDAAKNHVDTFVPPLPPGPDPDIPVRDLDPDQARLSVFSHGKNRERIFDVASEISSNGQVLENMLNSTIDQLGKGMDEKEKAIILCRIIEKHIFGVDR